MPRRRGRRGSGAITKRPNGKYQAQWSTTEGGKRVRRSETFDLKTDAEWWLRQAQRGSIPETDLTVAEYLERWLRGKRNIRPSTKALYASHVKVHIVPALGSYGVTELQPRHVERFVDGLTVSPGTVGLILRTLRSALEAGVRRHELPDNPAATVEAPKVHRPPVEPMTDDEADRILRAVEGTWIEQIVRFLMGSGCRIGEAVALDQRDVMDGYVSIRRPKTTPRATLVSEDGMAALRDSIRQAPRVGPKEPVFFGPKTGDRMTRHPVTLALARILVANGLPRLTAHKLRHGAATRMLSQGHSIKDDRRAVGEHRESGRLHLRPRRARCCPLRGGRSRPEEGMSKTMAESVEELDVAVANLGRVLVHELAASRVGRFLGWFYEWERPRIGDRLAKAATIILAANVLWLWPILIIEQALWAVGIGR